MGITNDIKYVKFIVNRWLWDKPELETFRQDLEQEGMLGLLESHGKWDSTRGQDKDLWRNYQVLNAIRKYTDRKERRHYKKPEVDHDSPYWDLEPTTPVDELESGPDPGHLRTQLMELTDGVKFTERQADVLKLFMEDNSFPMISETLGISRQRAERVFEEIVVKIRKNN